MSSPESVTTRPQSGYPADTLADQARRAPAGTKARLAGRLVLWRRMGGLVFGHLQDRSGSVQVSLSKNDVGAERFTEWLRAVKIGDFIGVSGTTFVTRKSEPTVAMDELVLLNRTVRALPDEWQGISNVDARYRRRYLDLLVNQDSRERFHTRARIVRRIRRFLDDNDFLEVETPMLQESASGAAARPFVTRHNALDEDFYLRISPETYLKRLVGGSLERVYELGRNFRNEGMDASHLQEFTMLEWYAAYWDFRDNMRFVRELILAVLDDVIETRAVECQGVVLNFDGEWPVLDYRTEVRRKTGIDLTEVKDLPTLRERVTTLGLDTENAASYAALVDLLYKKTVRPELIQPCFLINHPAELVPLARRNDDDPSRLDMFQVVVNGWEIVKAYSELIDPAEQRIRLEEQAQLRVAGDEETMMLEEDFLDAMEYGMPPMSGLGLGIDRFVALLTDAANLREIVLFPTMRSLHAAPSAE